MRRPVEPWTVGGTRGRWPVLEPTARRRRRRVSGCGVAGLTSADAAARLAKYGRNADAQARDAGLIVSVARRLLEPMCLILIAAAVVSAATGDVPSAVIILVILGASVTLDTVQEGGAKRAAEALRKSVALKAEVKRDGAFVSVDAETVVPGDVFRVDRRRHHPGRRPGAGGERLHRQRGGADRRALRRHQAARRGEGRRPPPRPATRSSAAPSRRPARRPRWRSAPGPTPCSARRRKSLNAAAEISPFQRDLRQLGFLVARATGVLVVGVLAANVAFGRPLIQSLMFSVALAVGLTPELLPMITTVTLSRGAVRMSRKKVIVKRLAAIHDLGAMTVLCTDKTGTLTSAEIELAGSLAPGGKPDERPATLASICATLGGDKGSLDDALTKARPDAAKGWTRRGLLPFDYQRRMGAVLAEGPDGLMLIVKGAPEAVLAACADRGWRRRPRRGGARSRDGADPGAVRPGAARRGGRVSALVRRRRATPRRTTRPASCSRACAPSPTHPRPARRRRSRGWPPPACAS